MGIWNDLINRIENLSRIGDIFRNRTDLNITILGAGAFGTSLALSIYHKNNVSLWEHDLQRYLTITQTRTNPLALKDASIPEAIHVHHDMEKALYQADIVLCVVPSHVVRSTMERAKPFLRKGMIIVSAAKGIEEQTDLRMTQVIKEITPSFQVLALSGPSHAEEIAKQLPTTLLIAGKHQGLCRVVQHALMTPYLRIYTNNDPIGVEIAGGLKNIIAIACGISDGFGFGDNTKSAIMTRGLAEMVRFGKKVGAKTKTFYGLAGIGDMITTCYSNYGRNLFVGRQLGSGKPLAQILSEMTQVAEGIRTTRAVYQYAQKEKIEMPITEQVYQILFDGKPIKDGVLGLMQRSAKNEDYNYLK